MCHGLLCEPEMNHSIAREWAGTLPVLQKQRLVMEAIRTTTVKEHLMGLLMGAERDNPRIRYWQQYTFSIREQPRVGILGNPTRNIECGQCWITKHTRPYLRCIGNIKELIKMCRLCIFETSKIKQSLNQVPDKEKGHMIVMILYAEAIIKAIATLIQNYQRKKTMPPLDPLRARQEAEHEYLCGGTPVYWGFSYYNGAGAFGYLGGTFVLPNRQLTRQGTTDEQAPNGDAAQVEQQQQTTRMRLKRQSPPSKEEEYKRPRKMAVPQKLGKTEDSHNSLYTPT